jgi:sulfate adenylyltransferase
MGAFKVPHGGFIEIHAAIAHEVCEVRDRKRLYAKARAGGFTGISDPYETLGSLALLIVGEVVGEVLIQ